MRSTREAGIRSRALIVLHAAAGKSTGYIADAVGYDPSAVLKVLQQPKVREQFAGLGLDAGSGATQDELSRSLRVASDKQAATLKAIGFKPE